MSTRRLASLLTRSRLRRARARGFTLIELLVATGAGLLVAMGALILSKNAQAVFQSESRISAAQLSATLGMNRLLSDLSRAGFLSTPNAQLDGSVCGSRATFPAGLQSLSAVMITQAGSVAAHNADLAQSVAAGYQPDSIIIGGAFDSTELFPVRVAGPDSGAYSVHLQTNSGAFQRTLVGATAGSASIQDIFATGRLLRIVGPLNQQVFGIISGVVTTGSPPTDVTINLSATLPLVTASGGQCGLTGLGSDWTVNAVSRVQYDLRSLAGVAQYAGLVAPPVESAGMTGDTGRTELTRVELDTTNNEIGSTLELVAEYAVDLTFGVRAMNGPIAGTNPTLEAMRALSSVGNSDVYDIAGDVSTSAAAKPQLIRAVQVRLSTRARAPDRAADITPYGPDGRRARMPIAIGALTQFARVRTLYAEVALQNLAGETW